MRAEVGQSVITLLNAKKDIEAYLPFIHGANRAAHFVAAARWLSAMFVGHAKSSCCKVVAYKVR